MLVIYIDFNDDAELETQLSYFFSRASQGTAVHTELAIAVIDPQNKTFQRRRCCGPRNTTHATLAPEGYLKNRTVLQ